MESKSYKKLNHFKEILAQFQVKDIKISDTVIKQIQQHIEKENISFEDLTYSRTKKILKELGLNLYCEHINFIRIKLGVNQLIIDVETKHFLNNFNKYYK
jgi:hypothetical protein